jgi:hypothetical protein
VTVLSDGQRLGLVARLNQIAAAAEAPLLARMDADDLMHPDRLARQVALFSGSGAVDVAGTGAFVVDGGREVLGTWSTAPLPRTVQGVLARGVLLIHPTVMYRTEFARSHPYDARYPRAEDLAQWCRIVEDGRYGLVDEPLLYYRTEEQIEEYRKLPVAVKFKRLLEGCARMSFLSQNSLLLET